MQFVKTVLWVALALVVALFAIRNSNTVTVNLWSDLQMVTPLWVVVVLSFLLGLVPALVIHRAARWSWRRRLEQAERAVLAAEARSLESAHHGGVQTQPGGVTASSPEITNG